jgi:hypothetical protein
MELGMQRKDAMMAREIVPIGARLQNNGSPIVPRHRMFGKAAISIASSAFSKRNQRGVPNSKQSRDPKPGSVHLSRLEQSDVGRHHSI